MNPPRRALSERFRSILLTRVRDLEKLLALIAEGRGDEAALREAMGQLHTLKGESKMLGLLELSRTAHALEELLLEGGAHDASDMPEAARAVRDVVQRIARALDEGLTAEEREARWRDLTVLAAHGAEPRSTPPAGGSSADPSDAPMSAEARPRRRERWAQVSAAVLDELCEKVEDFSTNFRLLHTQARGKVPGPMLEEFERCRSALDDFTEIAWSLRLVSVEPMLEDLAEHVRGLASATGKSVQVSTRSAGAQLERDILDRIWDALLHVVQNALDHGIEPPTERAAKSSRGAIAIAAESAGPQVVFSVSDDGHGIDVARVRRTAVERGLLPAAEAQGLSDAEAMELLFHHGFSTRAAADELSGRGVGLDVVRNRVESLGGRVVVESTPKLGTTFSLWVPSAMTRERMIVLAIGEALFGIPSRSVRSIVRLADARVEVVSGGRALFEEDTAVPLRSLARCLGIDSDAEEPSALVLELSGRTWATSVPEILGERDLVRRPVDAPPGSIRSVGASALLDDGRLVLVLQLDHLVQALRSTGRGARGPERTSAAEGRAPRSGPARRRQRVLVVDDSPVVCELVSEILASEGLDVEVVHDGTEALAALEVRSADLVLSDVEMPTMDGFSLLERIRKSRRDVPFVLLTTRGSPEDRRRATTLGANAYLIKSDFESGILLDTVRRFVDLGP